MSSKDSVFRDVMKFGTGDIVFVGSLPFLPPGGTQIIIIAEGFAFALEERYGGFQVIGSGIVRGSCIYLLPEVGSLH